MAIAKLRSHGVHALLATSCALVGLRAEVVRAAGALDARPVSPNAAPSTPAGSPSTGKISAVRVEVEFFQGHGTEPSNRATVTIADRRVRIEQHGADAEREAPIFLYRGDRNLLYSIVSEAKAYAQIAPAMLTRIGGSARGSRRVLEQGMNGAPEDQQRLFGHLIGLSELDPANRSEPLLVTRSLETSTVAGVSCRKAQIGKGARVLATGCIADWNVVGLAPSDVEVFRSLADLVRNAAGTRLPIPIEMVPGQPLDFVVQLGGFPLFFERSGQTAGSNAIRVARVERFEADAGLFEVPAGFAARSGPVGIGGLFAMFRKPAAQPVPAAPAPIDDEALLADSGGDTEEGGANGANPIARRRAFDPWRAARPANQRPIRLFEGAE